MSLLFSVYFFSIIHDVNILYIVKENVLRGLAIAMVWKPECSRMLQNVPEKSMKLGLEHKHSDRDKVTELTLVMLNIFMY